MLEETDIRSGAHEEVSKEDEEPCSESTNNIMNAFHKLKGKLCDAEDDTAIVMSIYEFSNELRKFQPSESDNVSEKGLDIATYLFECISPETDPIVVGHLLEAIAATLDCFKVTLTMTEDMMSIMEHLFTIEAVTEDALAIMMASDFFHSKIVTMIDWEKVGERSPAILLTMFRHILTHGTGLPPDFVTMMWIRSFEIMDGIVISDDSDPDDIAKATDMMTRGLAVLVLILKTYPEYMQEVITDSEPLGTFLYNVYAIDDNDIKRMVLIIIGYACGNRLSMPDMIEFLIEAVATPNRAVAIWALTNMLLAHTDCAIPRDLGLGVISDMSREIMDTDYRTMLSITCAIPCIIKHMIGTECREILFETGLFDSIPLLFETALTSPAEGTVLADVLMMLNTILETAYVEQWGEMCTPIVDMVMECEEIPECEERDILMKIIEMGL